MAVVRLAADVAHLFELSHLISCAGNRCAVLD
jgi:hypothetical protein